MPEKQTKNTLQRGTTLSSYSYSYYADGNQRTKTDNTGRTSTYTYDGLGRLKSEIENTGFNASYQYNRFDNRSSMTVGGSEAYNVTYVYDANNRLIKDTKTAGSITTIGNYYYDPNGNQIIKHTETLDPTSSII